MYDQLICNDSERAVIATLIVQPDLIDQVLEKLSDVSFFSPVHRTLFDVLMQMNAENIAVDILTLAQKLKDKNLLDSFGGMYTLTELSACAVSFLFLDAHVETVKSKYMLRQLLEQAEETKLAIMEGTEDAEALVNDAEKRMFAIQDKVVSSTAVDAKKATIDAIDQIYKIYENKGPQGITTGFEALDNLTTGFKAGEMIVVAGRPGMGKTALALSWAANMLEQGISVGFFSLEMTYHQLMTRLLSGVAEIPLQNLRKGSLSQHELDMLAVVSENMVEWPLVIEECCILTTGLLRAKARRLVKKGCKIIIIDYLQLLSSTSKKADSNRQVEVGEISRAIKSLALELKVPIIAMAQLNRKSDEVKDAEPQLHHLRESGSIEQDADAVMMIHRKIMPEDNGDANHVPAKIKIAKQRNGPVDSVSCVFKSSYAKYVCNRFDAAV